MLVKVSSEHITLDYENIKIREDDLKVEDNRVIISFDTFKELESVFSQIKKGLWDFFEVDLKSAENFNGKFEFKV